MQQDLKEIFGENEMPTILPTYFYSKETESSEKILKACEINQVVTQKMFERGSSFVPDPYRTEEKHKMQVGYLLLSLLITHNLISNILLMLLSELQLSG